MVKEKFLIDSNIFITPYQNFYPFDIAPGFWNQLESKLTLDEVFVLDVVRDEVIAWQKFCPICRTIPIIRNVH